MVRWLATLNIQTHLSNLKVQKFFNPNLLQYFKYDHALTQAHHYLLIISKQS